MRVGTKEIISMTPEDTAIVLTGGTTRGLMLCYELENDAGLMRNLAYWTAQNRLPATPGRSKGSTTRFRMLVADDTI